MLTRILEMLHCVYTVDLSIKVGYILKNLAKRLIAQTKKRTRSLSSPFHKTPNLG